MTDTTIYRDISQRTNGALMIGVVGPVRTGKSTFIKRFMETLVIPKIDNTYMKERARDELPQSGSGRTIMTSEPKFVPENAVSISMQDSTQLAVRLVDCVGYMVEGAAGQFENGEERLVTTPWFDHEITMTQAAEQGTERVIRDHSTIGIVITTDGSICDIPREKYTEPEGRVIRELQAIGKPFVVLLNCLYPDSPDAEALAEELEIKYSVRCIRTNCSQLSESEIVDIIHSVLEEFPVKSMGVFLPQWLEALSDDCALKSQMFDTVRAACSDLKKVKDYQAVASVIQENDNISQVTLSESDLGKGFLSAKISVPRALYYKTLSESTGMEINNDGDLYLKLAEMSTVKRDYDKLRCALEDVRTKGYGVVMPDSAEMQLEEPQIVRQGGKYSVKLKASAPAIHMMMTNIETEVTPAIGGETASEDIINFLLQGFDGDVNRIWQSNIFGKSLNDIAEEGLTSKIASLPDSAKNKLRNTLQRVINEGSGGLICIIL